MMINTALRRVSPILFRQCCSRNKSFSRVNLSSLTIFCKKREQNHTIVNTNDFYPHILTKKFSNSSPFFAEKPKEEEKVSIFQKFKKMSKDYWYVLIPVHVATSIVWFGGFYTMCKSGIDVAALLQIFGVSEAYVEKLSNSEMGYAALAYACYKIATPARYTVTVGGTTMTVKHLSDLGYLKTSHQVAEQFKEKADTIKQDVIDIKDDMRERNERMKDKFKDEWTDAWHKFAQKRKKK